MANHTRRSQKDYGKIKYKLIDSKGRVIMDFIQLKTARDYKKKWEDLTGEKYEIEYV